jgi:hypothetical protein
MCVPGCRDRLPSKAGLWKIQTPAVRIPQALLHDTNFDYNHHLFNTIAPPARSRDAETALAAPYWRPGWPARYGR